MNYIGKIDLDYQEVAEDDNLYEDVDLSMQDIVEAQYWEKNGHHGHPDICALPRTSTNRELQIQNSIPLSGYDRKKAKEMSAREQKMSILSLRELRLPFPFHSRIDQYLHSALISSYSRRRIGLTARPDMFEVGGRQEKAKAITAEMDITSNTMGFSIIGSAGTGKSTAFQLVSDKYPKVIRHDFPEFAYYQIPIIRLTAFANGNLSALYVQFARLLDALLDSGTHYAEIKGVGNLGKQTSIICQWIKRYHIGVIAIDEVQLMDFSASSQKSIENLLTVTAATGVALVMIGTQDASRHWQDVLRLRRRTEGWMVRADEYCMQKDFMDLIIKRVLEYQWQNKEIEITRSLVDAMYKESMGSIDMLILLWMMVQFEATTARREPEINAEYIRKIAESKFGEMRKLLEESLVESEQRYLGIRESVLGQIKRSMETDEDRKAMEEMKAESARNVREHYNRDMQLGSVTDAILCCYPKFSELSIRRAYAKAENTEGFIKMGIRQKTQLVLDILRKANVGKTKGERNKAKSKEKEKMMDTKTMRDALENSMDIKNGVGA